MTHLHHAWYAGGLDALRMYVYYSHIHLKYMIHIHHAMHAGGLDASRMYVNNCVLFTYTPEIHDTCAHPHTSRNACVV